jgi:hypothetical protein
LLFIFRFEFEWIHSCNRVTQSWRIVLMATNISDTQKHFVYFEPSNFFHLCIWFLKRIFHSLKTLIVIDLLRLLRFERRSSNISIIFIWRKRSYWNVLTVWKVRISVAVEANRKLNNLDFQKGRFCFYLFQKQIKRLKKKALYTLSQTFHTIYVTFYTKSLRCFHIYPF